LREIDLPPRVARPGDRIPLGKDASIEILWPAAGLEGLDANDTSLVLKLTKGDRTILFTGDIQTDGMKGLLADPDKLRADVLVAPHHGSSEDITPTFVEAVKPEWIVASDDRTPSGKQKRFDAMTAGRRVLRTHEYGAITIVIDADGTMSIDGFAKRIR
jgi:competence protein ComEC